MDFQSIFKLADEVEGCFVEAGFGKGKTADTILGLMNDGLIRKRRGYLLDLFNNVPIQPAFDRRFALPGFDISVVKGDVKDTINGSIEEKIAIAHIDIDTEDGLVHALKEINTRMAKYGVIALTLNSQTLKGIVNKFIETEKIGYKVRKTEEGFLYLYSKDAPILLTLKPETRKEGIPVPEVRSTHLSGRQTLKGNSVNRTTVTTKAINSKGLNSQIKVTR